MRSTDYAANKGVGAIYVLDLGKGGQPVKVVDKGSSARWSADGRSLYFVAPAKGVAQLWRVDLGGEGGLDSTKFELAKPAVPVQVSHSVLDLGGYKLSPDGKQVLLSYEVFTDCAALACTQQRVDARAKDKASGTLYGKLFVRHWDAWADGRRYQLFVARFDDKGQLAGEPYSAFALIHSTGEGIEIAEMTGGDGVHDRPVDGAVAVYGDVAEADRFA